jgi:hypothetical protein
METNNNNSTEILPLVNEAQEGESSFHENFSTGVNNNSFIRNNDTDLIAKKYEILVKKPLTNFDTLFCKAYEVYAQHTKSNDFYALVFDPALPNRQHIINALKKEAVEHCIMPIEAEITKLSLTHKQHLVAILPKPQGVTLTDYVQTKGPCHINFTIEKIIHPLNKILNTLFDLNIVHGRVNPDNIYINDNYQITLGECISDLPGYSQPTLYEPIERIDIINFGKGESNNKVDSFALGAVIVFLLSGQTPNFDKDVITNEDNIIYKRLTNGTYSTLVGDLAIQPYIKELLKGLLSDRRSERWTPKKVTEWLQGKTHNTIYGDEHIEASRHVIFNGKHYFNRKSLVHDLFKNWEIAKKFLKEDHLIKWIERSINDTNMAEHLQHIQKLSISTKSFSNDEDDMLLAKSLIALDPGGPIRINGLAINLEALNILLLIGYIKEKKFYIDFFKRIMSSKLWLAAKESSLIDKDSLKKALSWKLERITEYLYKINLGFGIERCLYDLNPSLPCQSSLVKGYYIETLLELMQSLENIASLNPNEIMDKHIAAFIASKLDIGNDIVNNNSSTSDLVKFFTNKELITIVFLSLVQKKLKIKKLPNLTNYLSSRLSSLTNLLYSRTIKEEIIKRIKVPTEEGDLVALCKIISDNNYMKRDIDGFNSACMQYKTLDWQIAQLRKDKKIYDIGYKYGLRISVILSYLICSIVFILLMSKSVA